MCNGTFKKGWFLATCKKAWFSKCCISGKGGRFFRSVKSVGIVVFSGSRKSYLWLNWYSEINCFWILVNFKLNFLIFYKSQDISSLKKYYQKPSKTWALDIIVSKSEERILIISFFQIDMVHSKIMVSKAGIVFGISPLSLTKTNARNEKISPSRLI